MRPAADDELISCAGLIEELQLRQHLAGCSGDGGFTAEEVKRLLREARIKPRPRTEPLEDAGPIGALPYDEQLLLLQIIMAQKLNAAVAAGKRSQEDRDWDEIRATEVKLRWLLAEAHTTAARLKRLLGEVGYRATEIPEIVQVQVPDPVEGGYHELAWELFLLCRIYSGPREKTPGNRMKVGIHRNSAAARFIAAALTEAGWRNQDNKPLTPEAVAKSVLRWRRSRGTNANTDLSP
jgi:hypothetical protein